MATKNNRRTIVTKRILKESLLELMVDHPIGKITIKDICDRSEMSRSTFYLHYQDPYELLTDIENEVLEKTFENLSSLETELSAIDSVTIFLRYVKTNKATFGILLCQPENRTFQQAIMNNVRQLIRDRVPSMHPDEKEQFLYSFVMQGCLSVIVDWIRSDFKMPTKEVAALLFHACDCVFKG